MAFTIEISANGILQKAETFQGGLLEEAARSAVLLVEQNNSDTAVIKDADGKLAATVKLGS